MILDTNALSDTDAWSYPASFSGSTTLASANHAIEAATRSGSPGICR